MPARSKRSSVPRTQESGESERRQTVRSTRCPCQRPIRNQTVSASSVAPSATARAGPERHLPPLHQGSGDDQGGERRDRHAELLQEDVAEDDGEAVAEEKGGEVVHGGWIVARARGPRPCKPG